MSTTTFGGTGLFWGAVLAAAMVGYHLILRRLRMDSRATWRWAVAALPPVAALTAQRSWSSAGGAMAYADGFVLAAIVVAMGTASWGVAAYAYDRWVDDAMTGRIGVRWIRAATALFLLGMVMAAGLTLLAT